MDADVRFEEWSDVVRYLPKSLSIALLAPFPWQWFDMGGRTRIFRTLTALEALLMYVLVVGLLFRLPQVRRYANVPLATVFLFVLASAVPMALTVANLGTLFRLRLHFVFPLITLLCGVDIWGAYRRILRRIAHPGLR